MKMSVQKLKEIFKSSFHSGWTRNEKENEQAPSPPNQTPPLGTHLLDVAARLHVARKGVISAQHHEESNDEGEHLEAVRVLERRLHSLLEAAGEVQGDL